MKIIVKVEHLTTSQISISTTCFYERRHILKRILLNIINEIIAQSDM